MGRHRYTLCTLLWAAALLVSGWLLLPGSSRAGSDAATVRYVAPGGDCGGKTPCYASLQKAVNASSAGDRVLIAAGRYTGVTTRGGSAQLVYLDKAITLQGGYHAQTWQRDLAANATVLDAEGQGRVLTIIGAAAVVDGFRLTNGSAGNGGGVYVESTGPTLSRNHIYGNWAEGYGGGLYLKGSAAQLRDNHIYTNTTGPSGRGGGLALIDSPATVTDNVIEDNRAHVGGGVLINSTLSAGGALLEGNAIRNNTAFDLEQDGRTFDGAGGALTSAAT